MSSKILVGPLLGLESESCYSVCFSSAASVNEAAVVVKDSMSGDEQIISARSMGKVASGSVWRATIAVQAQNYATELSYRVLLGGTPASNSADTGQWSFSVPVFGSKPNMAYASCNGFSSLDIMTKTERPYALWESLKASHESSPYAALLMGGDQVYADSIWGAVPELRKWNELPLEEKQRRKASALMVAQIDRFYDQLYRDRWSNPAMNLMMASIPSVMMWDDHDIFDGWGSFPESLQSCAVFQAIFERARHYFLLFQIRSLENTALLDSEKEFYSQGVPFHGYHILALDNRSERTREQVMGSDHWNCLNDYLEGKVNSGDLLLMSAVPVVYRDFTMTETAFDYTPWEEELTDDLKDHWRAKDHEGERARLIMRLLQNARRRPSNRTLILSGDVHIGCAGVILDRRDPVQRFKIHQVVSSGIVHPAPSRVQWLGIMAVTNDKSEYLTEDRSIKVSLLKPFGSKQYIRTRNFVTLSDGNDGKLWVNWITENGDSPYYPLDK